MIRENEFNSAWWGEPVGILEDPSFFRLGAARRDAALSAYSWVEFRCPIEAAPPLADIEQTGFVQFDTQIEFRIGLRRVPDDACLSELDVSFADERHFSIGTLDLAPFRHERFSHLPDITPAKLDERYALWANDIIAREPAWCVQVSKGVEVQGWFLAERDGEGLRLSLAMTHRAASISGMYVYQKSLVEYGRRGARVGHAGFSVRNVAVHNIYTRLGAVFVPPVGCWVWLRRAR